MRVCTVFQVVGGTQSILDMGNQYHQGLIATIGE